MKLRWTLFAVAGFAGVVGLVAADPALARVPHHKVKHYHKYHHQQRLASCAPRPADWSFRQFWFAGSPQPNGCAPPVFVNGEYIGQDPDPNIRFQLRRDPNTGFTVYKP